MDDLKIISFPQIESVPEGLWSELSDSESLFSTPRWNRALRRSNPRVTVEFWAIRDKSGWLLGVPVHVYPEAPARSTYNIWSLHGEDFVPVGESRAESLARPHVLIGTRNGQRNGFLRTPHKSRIGLEACLLHAIESAHTTAIVSMLYLDRATIDALSPQLQEWHAHFVDVAGELEVPDKGEDLESFLAAADHGTRRRVRAEIRQMTGGFVEQVEGPKEIEALAPLLAPLLVNVQVRNGEKSDVADMTSYLCSVAHSGLEPVLFMTGPPDEPVAFSLSVSDGKLLSVRVAGLDHVRLTGAHIADYGRVSLYEPLKYAMRVGARAVDLGTGTLHAKLLRGAKPVPLYSLSRLPVDLNIQHSSRGDFLRAAAIGDSSTKLADALTSTWPVPVPEHISQAMESIS